MDPFERYVNVKSEDFHRRLEEACEAALQSGEYGVLVSRSHPLDDATIEVSDKVPYGVIAWQVPEG